MVMFKAQTGTSSPGRNLVTASLVLAMLGSVAPSVGHSFPFGRKKAPAKVPSISAQQKSDADIAAISAMNDKIAGQSGIGAGDLSGPATKPAAPAKPEPPATPAQRKAALNMDLISQSRFWVNELQKVPSDVEAALYSSVALRAIGSYDRAVQTASLGLQASPNHAGLWAAMALAMVADGQNEPSIKPLQKAIALNPRDISLLNGLGIVYDRLEAPAYAAKAYQAALAITPNDTITLTNYGLSVALSGDLPRGEGLLRQAVQDPVAPKQARQNLALVVGLQGRFKESQELAARDLPPEIATENIAYLRRMLDKTASSDNRWNQAASQSN